MTLIIVRSLITLTLLVAFIGLWMWAWSKRRREDFEAAALLPLQDDDRILENERP